MLARVKQLEQCNRDMFGDIVVTCQTAPKVLLATVEAYVPPMVIESRKVNWDSENEKRRASLLVDQLLSDIYSKIGNENSASDYNSGTSSKSGRKCKVDEKGLWDRGECLVLL